MADAYCGPSNALQAFQKHTSVDRTLQQDRVVTRRSPLEGFRSADPNAGLLDPEFEAFQASLPGPLAFGEHIGLPSINQRGKQPAFSSFTNNSDWASDFQRLQLSNPTSQQHNGPSPSQYMTMQPLGRTTASLNSGPATYAPALSNTLFQPSYRPQAGGSHFRQGFSQVSMPPQSQQQQVVQPIDSFDEAAFERAFEDARESIMSYEAAREDPGVAQSPPQIQNPYPHLPILRLALARSLASPTEENMHKVALYMSLLEQHDIRHIDQTQSLLFTSILDAITESGSPFNARYNLRERAQKLRMDFADAAQANVNVDKRVSKAASYYAQLISSAQGTPQAMTTFTSASNEAMQEDISLQLEGLKGQDVAERVFSAIPETSVDKAVHSDVGRAVRLEAELQMDYSHVVRTNLRGLYHTMWSSAHETAFAPENVELRDALTSQKPSSSLADMDMRQFEEAIQSMPDQLQQTTEDLQRSENDDLARTAGELLTKVQDNQSDKFKNSAFLDLMRRFRDREVEVEGDAVVETSGLSQGTITDTGSTSGPQNINLVTPIRTAPNVDTMSDVQHQETRDGGDIIRILDEPGELDQGSLRFPTEPAMPDEWVEKLFDDEIA